MQINKPKKRARRQPADTLFNNDFASGFEDSKWDKFKPAIKVLVLVILLVGAIWGTVIYFGSIGEDKSYKANTEQQDDDKLAQCALDMEAKNPVPEAGDDSFYPKLIAYYDAQIDCYDQYPNARSVVSRSSLEYARDNALDSSGDYKDAYAGSVDSGSGDSYSIKNSVTGCDYSLSESKYLACSDKYYAAHSSPSNTASSNLSSPDAPSYTTPQSNSSTPSSAGRGSDSSPPSSEADRSYWQTKCEEQVRQQSGGTGLTATQRAKMVTQCMNGHGY